MYESKEESSVLSRLKIFKDVPVMISACPS